MSPSVIFPKPNTKGTTVTIGEIVRAKADEQIPRYQHVMI